MNKKISMIVACTNEGGIAYNDAIPWYIPEDLKKFKEITTRCSSLDKQNAVIMGRNTWESIGKKLPNRLNIIITSDYKYKNRINDTEDIMIAHSIMSALAYCNQPYIDNIFIIGGTSLYNTFLQSENYAKLLHCIYMSVIFYDKTPNTVDKFIDIDKIFGNFILIKDVAYHKEAENRLFASYVCFPKHHKNIWHKKASI